MRTTLDLEEDVLQTAKAVASARGVSLGKAVSSLIRESFARPPQFDRRNGIPIMPTLPGSTVLNNEDVAAALNQEDEELSHFLLPRP